MPRERKYPETIMLECRGCGWKWLPRPKRWRNHFNVTSVRVLKCPSCGLPNKISAETVRMIRVGNISLR